MKKSNKKILDLPFGDNEFEIVDADEYIDTILYGNNEERENKTFKKLSREQKMVLKAIVQDEVTFYWQAHLAKTEHSHPLGMVVSTHFRCGKGVKRGLKNGALPFNID